MHLKRRFPMSGNHLKIFGGLLALTLLIMMLGCVDSTTILKESAELIQKNSQQIYHKDYTYYYIGRENIPIAIIGIDNKFAFEPDFWQKFPSDPDSLARMMDRLSNYTKQPRGYYLRGPEGQQIGFLFSVRGWYAAKIKENGKVEILASGFMDPNY